MSRFIPTTRAFTGCLVHRAYVLSEETRRVIWACPHRHRKHTFAQNCAERQVALLVREIRQFGLPLSVGDQGCRQRRHGELVRGALS